MIQWKWPPPSISTAIPSSNKQLSRGCAFGIFMVALIMFGSIIILAALLPMNRLVQTQATAEAVRVARIAEKAVTRARFQREAEQELCRAARYRLLDVDVCRRAAG